MKKAVIDVGTNSTRLYIADVSGNVQTKILKLLATTRLGEGITASRQMGEQPIKRTSDKIAEYVNIARESGLADGDIYIYATAVTREASNKNEFAEAVKRKTGIELDIIPGELEGKIAYIGAAAGREGHAVIDIGGGSTEAVTGSGGVFRALSQKIGGVRLKEVFETPLGTVDMQKVRDYASGFMPAYSDTVSGAVGLIGVSGTPTTLASLHLGLKTYCPDKIQDMRFKRSDMEAQLELMARQTSEERRMYSGDFAPRADIIVFGGCILSSFMEFFGFDEVIISDRDSLEGYLAYKMGTATAPKKETR